MSLNSSFFTLFSNINNGFIFKKSFIKQTKSKKVIKILYIFMHEGIIRSYSIKSNYIIIYLKKKNFFKINYISKPSKSIFIKNKNLIKKKGFFIVSTSLGFFTNQNLQKINLGGKLICQLQEYVF